MTTFKTSPGATQLLESVANKEYNRGNLLALDVEKFSLKYPAFTLKAFRAGYPIMSSETNTGNYINSGRPFMFINWASYDKQWNVHRSPGNVNVYNFYKSELGSTYDNKANPKYLIGLNVLIQNKVMFLTCGLYYNLDFVREAPEQVILLNTILPNIKKIL